MPAVPGPGGPHSHRVDLAPVPAKEVENDENAAALEVANVGPAPASTLQLYIRLPSGITKEIELSAEQQKKLQELCKEIAGGVEEFNINISDLLLTKGDGKPSPLSLEDGKRLQEFIKTEVKKDFKFSRTYASTEARSFESASKSEWPLSKFPTINFKKLFSKEKKLDGTEFTFADKVHLIKRNKAQEILFEQTGQYLEARKATLEEEKKDEATPSQRRAEIQSLLQRIEKAKEELAQIPFFLAFEATHPLSDPTDKTIEAKRELAMKILETTRDSGVIGKATKVLNYLTGKGPTDVEDTAKDLALGSIKDRSEYLAYCSLLQTEPKKEWIEHLFNSLIDGISENRDTDAILEGHLFKTTFRDILAEEDANVLKEALKEDCKTLKGAFHASSLVVDENGKFVKPFTAPGLEAIQNDADVEALKNAIDLEFAFLMPPPYPEA